MAFSTLTLGIALVALAGSTAVQAEYKPELNRYDHLLSVASPEAIYNYNYENTSADTAPSYFELSLENLSGSKVADLIEIKSITETTPIDFETKKPAEGAKTTEFKVSDAVYSEGNVLKIRISPQSECKVRPEGGCADGMVPAAVPARISIKVALKANASTASAVLFGSGRLYFPSGFDANQISWKINIGQADESGVVLPTIKEETLDMAALESNQAIAVSQNTDATIGATTKMPADLEVGKIETMNTPALNSQNIKSDQAVENTALNNDLVLIVGGIAGVGILAGAALFALNIHKKNAKTK